MTKLAMFAGLVVDEEDKPVDVTWVGSEQCYVVADGDFSRHVDAETVDYQVLQYLKGQVESQREAAVLGVLEMLGQDDLFTKAAVESSINRMDEVVGQPMPEDARRLLGMMGFRIVVDLHGNVVEVDMPAGGIDDGES